MGISASVAAVASVASLGMSFASADQKFGAADLQEQAGLIQQNGSEYTARAQEYQAQGAEYQAQGVEMTAKGTQASDNYQAARADEAAKFGRLQADLTDTTLRENLNVTLANIDAIRAGGNVDSSSPTGIAIKEHNADLSDRQRVAQLVTARSQAADDEASAAYLRKAGEYALLQGGVGASAIRSGGAASLEAAAAAREAGKAAVVASRAGAKATTASGYADIASGLGSIAKGAKG